MEIYNLVLYLVNLLFAHVRVIVSLSLRKAY